MLVLGIETSSPSGGVALFDGTRLLGAQSLFSSRAHSRLILPAVELMLRELKLRVNDLDVVAVSHGPGSFTGVRVGMALAIGLCEPGQPKLITVSTLEALAWRAYSGEPVEYVLPLLNARQGQVYGAVFPVSGEIGPIQGEEFALSPSELIGQWPGRCLVAGEGAVEYRAQWEQLGDRFVLARADRLHPSPEQVALLGLRAAQRGEFADPETAGPVYLREASTSKPRRQTDAK